MGFFSSSSLDPRIAQAVIGTDRYANRKVAKIQGSLLSYLERDEILRIVAGDVQMGSVMAVTNRRILYGDGKHIDYILPGDRVANVTISQDKMSSGRYSHRFIVEVTWSGGPLKHENIKNFYIGNDFLMIIRWAYDEADLIAQDIRTAFLGGSSERDVEGLYPAFFERIIRATGHSWTPSNVRHLIDRVAFTITQSAALPYFEKVGDERARAEFLETFDLDAISDERALHVCDEMIDWLWNWNYRCRKDLSERIPRLEALLSGPDSALRSCGPDIPPWR